MKKTILKTALLFHTTQSIIIYVIVYLIYTFSIWRFKNPFEWIIDMPTYRNEDRFAILFGILFYTTISIGIHYISLNDKA